jgi:hypothetical protein
MAANFFESGQKWCCDAGVFIKMFHVKRQLVQENKTRIIHRSTSVAVVRHGNQAESRGRQKAIDRKK